MCLSALLDRSQNLRKLFWVKFTSFVVLNIVSHSISSSPKLFATSLVIPGLSYGSPCLPDKAYAPPSGPVRSKMHLPGEGALCRVLVPLTRCTGEALHPYAGHRLCRPVTG